MMMFGNMKNVKTVATLLAVCISVTTAAAAGITLPRLNPGARIMVRMSTEDTGVQFPIPQHVIDSCKAKGVTPEWDSSYKMVVHGQFDYCKENMLVMIAEVRYWATPQKTKSKMQRLLNRIQRRGKIEHAFSARYSIPFQKIATVHDATNLTWFIQCTDCHKQLPQVDIGKVDKCSPCREAQMTNAQRAARDRRNSMEFKNRQKAAQDKRRKNAEMKAVQEKKAKDAEMKAVQEKRRKEAEMKNLKPNVDTSASSEKKQCENYGTMCTKYLTQKDIKEGLTECADCYELNNY